MPHANTYEKRRRLLSLTCILALGAGCESSPREPPAPGATVPLAPPTGEGSGEPFLSTSGDVLYLSWLQPSEEGGHELLLSSFADGSWTDPHRVARSEDFFVNWADFPSVVADASGRLWAHWLQRGGKTTYDYGIRIARSTDRGRTWSEPWTPHTDSTPTEHGFVSMLPLDDGIGISWLDGRQIEPGPGGSVVTKQMSVRFRTVAGDGTPGPERLLDPRSCDCCQTDAALAASGPVVVYRDRTEDEVRDIFITRREGKAWSTPRAVHDDGWHIAGCPVNGPAVGALGTRVAVAWFTAADDVPLVNVAFSGDGGVSFAAPVRVDGGNPGGRVDLLMQDDGSALVSWLERTGAEGAEVRLRRVTAAGSLGTPMTVATSSAGRASGFPRMAQTAGGDVFIAWTDIVSAQARVLAARVEVPSP